MATFSRIGRASAICSLSSRAAANIRQLQLLTTCLASEQHVTSNFKICSPNALVLKMKQGTESRRRGGRLVPEQILQLKKSFPSTSGGANPLMKQLTFPRCDCCSSIKPSLKLLPFSYFILCCCFLKGLFQNSSGSHLCRATTLQRLSVVPYN